ncbi:DUF6615 family protein [Streptomyces sp. NPDC008196]|uniref:DUF6615 family protein n=1 Tax=Streptomyces sp. NPDC008196 TaxID=3364819 RepID=UPI0036DFC6F7
MKHQSETGEMWREETVTDILCQHAYPSVRYVRFNPRQEAKVGSDWLWWWRDTSGTCFGMLVQAKSLKQERGKWNIDFNYGKGRQIDRLIDTAAILQIPAIYTIYCGDVTYRRNLTCGFTHSDSCSRCSRAGVSVIDALGAKRLTGAFPDSVGTWAFQFSSPLEDLADPGRNGTQVISATGPVLSGFLAAPATKSREIAVKIYQLATRTIIYNFVDQAGIVQRLDSFAPYFLQGWRADLPQYVEHALNDGNSAARELPESIAGIVLLEL